MSLFSGTGRGYDKRKEEIKDLKGSKDKDSKKKRRRLKRLNRKERQLLATAAAQSKITEIISSAGQILAPQVLRNIPVYGRRMKNGRCPGCGEPAEKRGYVCSDCLDLVREMPSAHQINLTNMTPKGVKGIPSGQNINGIVNCDCGHRIMPGASDCHMGCVAYISKGKKCIHG